MALTTDYFKGLVKSETKRLNELCGKWDHIMDNQSDITEEGFGQIRSTIGKTNLLIDQRFKQFNGLVDDCHLKRGVKETKVEDLQGFWEMIYFQIEDLNQGFERLDQLLANKWVEPEVIPKPVVKKSSKVVPKQNTNKPNVKSKIREQIQNLKNSKTDHSLENNESFGEKENKTTDKAINGSKSVGFDVKTESMSEVRTVLKRTPLLPPINAIKK